MADFDDVCGTEFNVESLTLERVDLFTRQVVSDALLDYPQLRKNARVRHAVMQSSTDLVLMLTSWCHAGRIPDRIESETISFPDGPWNSWKHKYAPEWFLKKFPVKFVRTTIEKDRHIYFVCPHFVTDAKEAHVKFMATGNPKATKLR